MAGDLMQIGDRVVLEDGVFGVVVDLDVVRPGTPPASRRVLVRCDGGRHVWADRVVLSRSRLAWDAVP